MSKVLCAILVDVAKLPIEIALQIIDLAGYWKRHGPFGFHDADERCTQTDKCVLKSPALSLLGLQRLRQIRLQVSSHDQGWSSEGLQYQGTYEHSWTWYEARVVRQGHSSTHPLYRNRHASKVYESYTIALYPGLLNDLQYGDCIEVWMCARFPGWTNYCRRAEMELYFVELFDDVELIA